MAFPLEDQFTVIQPDLNWPKSEQSDIVSKLSALACKEQINFPEHNRAIDSLKEEEI